MEATIAQKLMQVANLLVDLAGDFESADGVHVAQDDPDGGPRKNLPPRNKELPNVRLKWRDEDITKLLSLYELGVDKKEIARLLGRTPASIHDRLFHHQWGLLRNDDEVDPPDAT